VVNSIRSEVYPDEVLREPKRLEKEKRKARFIKGKI